jgi:alginate O-acetyltransferase complex protein AlgI
MLFNSYTFVLLFLPSTLVTFLLLTRVLGLHRLALLWLVFASFIFYGYWDAHYVLLLAGSALANFHLAGWIDDRRRSDGRHGARLLLLIGIVFNLGLLGYFKYTNFFFEIGRELGATAIVTTIVLPIGISFFTFQQIAFLVDARRGQPIERDIVRYLLFVTFFPQLIAGPIVHHREMMPQFGTVERTAVSDDLAIGITIFVIGLAKKVLLADSAALVATPVFQLADGGGAVSLLDAWAGMLAYMAQIYFDFAGYSDMAVGLGRMFGITLPINFASPYQATSIIDFWRRWHITLSRFMRDYLYVALGGNRRGVLARYRNVFATMVLAGIWHGAGWTFLVWGTMHAVMICVNTAWREFATPSGRETGALGRWLRWAVTMLCVALAWVPFRATTLSGALAIYAGLVDVAALGHQLSLMADRKAIAVTAFSLLLAAFAPNIYQLMSGFDPALGSRGYPATQPDRLARDRPSWACWRPSPMFAVGLAIVFVLAFAAMNEPSEFLYFDF